MLVKTIDDESGWAVFVREVSKHGGFLARSTGGPPPQLFAAVDITVRGPGGDLARVKGQVVQMTPAGEVAVMLAAEEKAKLMSVQFTAASPAARAPAREPTPPPAREAAPRAASAPASQEAWALYEEMSKIEKIKLARQGNADARRRVLKDRDQSLHPFVLENPGITASEIAALVRSGIGGGMLKKLGERSELAGQPMVAEALVSNPSTPLPLAVQLIAKVPVEVARRIAKAGNLRPQIVQAARKRVIPG